MKLAKGWRWFLLVLLLAVVTLPFWDDSLLEMFPANSGKLEALSNLLSILASLSSLAYLLWHDRYRVYGALQACFYRNVTVVVIDIPSSSSARPKGVHDLLEKVIARESDSERTLLGYLFCGDQFDGVRRPRKFENRSSFLHALENDLQIRSRLPGQERSLASDSISSDSGTNESIFSALASAVDILDQYPAAIDRRVFLVTDGLLKDFPLGDLEKHLGSGQVRLKSYTLLNEERNYTASSIYYLSSRRPYRPRYGLALSLLALVFVLAFLHCWIGSVLGFQLDYFRFVDQSTIEVSGQRLVTGESEFGWRPRSKAMDALKSAYRGLADGTPAVGEALEELRARKFTDLEDMSQWIRERLGQANLHVLFESVSARWLDCCSRATVLVVSGREAKDIVQEIAAELIIQEMESSFVGEQLGFVLKDSPRTRDPVRISFQDLNEIVGRALSKPEVMTILQGKGYSLERAERILLKVRQFHDVRHIPNFDSAGYLPSEFVELGLRALATILDQEVSKNDLLALEIRAYGYADPNTVEKPIPNKFSDEFYFPDREACPGRLDELPLIDGSRRAQVAVKVPGVIFVRSRRFYGEGRDILRAPPGAEALGEALDDNCELSVARAFGAITSLQQAIGNSLSDRTSLKFRYGYAGGGTRNSPRLEGMKPDSAEWNEEMAKLRKVEIFINRVNLEDARIEESQE